MHIGHEHLHGVGVGHGIVVVVVVVVDVVVVVLFMVIMSLSSCIVRPGYSICLVCGLMYCIIPSGLLIPSPIPRFSSTVWSLTRSCSCWQFPYTVISDSVPMQMFWVPSSTRISMVNVAMWNVYGLIFLSVYVIHVILRLKLLL